MKKLLVMMACVLMGTAALAQNNKEGVNFESLTMQQLMDRSARENKPIFIDVYATWCGPCKYMANNVFTQKKVGDYFNSAFVNAKFDAEKGEGIEVARKYGVKAYPTFLILDSKGNEIARIVGGANADDFLKMVQDKMKK